MMCYTQKLYLFSDYFHFQTIFYFLKKIETYLVLEAHGPHCSPEKQFQPVGLWLYCNIVKIIISFLRMEWSYICKNFDPLYPKIIFKYCQCIFAIIAIISSLKRPVPFTLSAP